MRVFLLPFLFLFISSSLALECTKLSASGVPQYVPYSWTSSAEPTRLEGALVKMMSLLAKDSGLDISMNYVGPWARTQAEMSEGRLDLIAGIFYNDTRNTRMDFLSPVMLQSDSRAWVAANSNAQINSLDDLKKYQGVAVINYSFGKNFDQYISEHLKVIRVSFIEQAIKMLQSHRVDYLLYEEEPGKAYIAKAQADFRMLPLLLSHEGIYLAISKKSLCNTQEIKRKLNNSLKKAQKENWIAPLLQQAHEKWLSE